MTMTIQELDQAIRELIRSIYKAEYVGSLKIKELKDGYDLALGFNHTENPIHIAASLTAVKFLKYVEEELKNRRFANNEYYSYRRQEMYQPECLHCLEMKPSTKPTPQPTPEEDIEVLSSSDGYILVSQDGYILVSND